ncbi:MAG: hypothetical protein U0800_25585 [Isosphaeraceae bacterium]
MIAAMRRVLAGRGFVEVETPTMQAIAGGAATRPFVYLPPWTCRSTCGSRRSCTSSGCSSAATPGGLLRLERVYRNEGLSRKHNPEFTMLEAYQAYGGLRQHDGPDRGPDRRPSNRWTA